MSYLNWKELHEKEFIEKVLNGEMLPYQTEPIDSNDVCRATHAMLKFVGNYDDVKLLVPIFVEYLYETYNIDLVDALIMALIIDHIRYQSKLDTLDEVMKDDLTDDKPKLDDISSLIRIVNRLPGDRACAAFVDGSEARKSNVVTMRSSRSTDDIAHDIKRFLAANLRLPNPNPNAYYGAMGIKPKQDE